MLPSPFTEACERAGLDRWWYARLYLPDFYRMYVLNTNV